jgi:hypothetical protein
MAENIENLNAEISEAVERGIIFDIYRAYEALHMFSVISDNAEFINSDIREQSIAKIVTNFRQFRHLIIKLL